MSSPLAASTVTADQLVQGSLFTKEGRVPLKYLPIEISRLTFAFVAEAGVRSGQRLIISAGNRDIDLLISSIHPESEGLVQIRSKVLDHKISLEKALVEVEELKGVIDHLAIRAARIESMDGLFVSAKTFGSMEEYRLAVGNVSKTGMKLLCAHGEIAPFSINTVVELVIDPGSKVMSRPLMCIGKIMRREESAASECEFGLRFVENDDRFIAAWSVWVDQLETQTSKDGSITQVKSA